MWVKIERGLPIPPKVWMRALDVLVEYSSSGIAFVAAGRPKQGPVAERFAAAEAEYDRMADAIWFAKWTDNQREEWSRTIQNAEASHENN